MKLSHFNKAQELSRLAQLTGDSKMWRVAMKLLRRAFK